MKLERSGAALADLDRFAAFLQERHPRLAKIIAAEIKIKAHILSDHPYANCDGVGSSSMF
jgi:plasmid stabilization system protein ParE